VQGTALSAGSPEAPATLPVVLINGGIVANAYLEKCEDAVDPMPARAFIRFLPPEPDFTGNFTLRSSVLYLRGARVQVVNGDGGSNLFLGQLEIRRDLGQPNSVIWEAHGDLCLLNFIPVRGCLVWDARDNCAKLLSNYNMRINPSGYRNCMMVGGLPYFSAMAEAGAGYDLATTDTGTDGLGFWTPRRLLLYAYLLANLTHTTPGCGPELRSLATSKRLAFPKPTFQTITGDDLDTKCPDHTFQKQTLGGLIHTALQMGGPVLGMRIDSTGPGSKSFVDFYPVVEDYTGTSSGKILYLQRSGPIADILSAFDFELEDDSTQQASSILAEGAGVVMEGRFKNEGGYHHATEDPAGASLIMSWNFDEWWAWCRIINGWFPDGNPKPDPKDRVYAHFPLAIPDVTKNETWQQMQWAVADGGGSGPSARPKIYANTPEARNFARSFLTRVWRTLEIDAEQAYIDGTLQGPGGEFNDTALYPVLKTIRRVLPEQLQFYVDSQDRKIRIQLPIRIQLDADEHDIAPQQGITIRADGKIYCDGMTDGMGQAGTTLFDPSVEEEGLKAPENLTLKMIELNAAVELDFRAMVEVQQPSQKSPLDSQLDTDLGGPLQHYLDMPEGYRRDGQYRSYPCQPNISDQAPPFSRWLRDDLALLTAHATRRGKMFKEPRKLSSWSFPGIRSDIHAGDWITSITLIGDDAQAVFIVNAPATNVIYDATHQRTDVGGILTMDRTANDALPTQGPVTMTGPRMGGRGSGSKAPVATSYTPPAASSPQAPESPQEGPKSARRGSALGHEADYYDSGANQKATPSDAPAQGDKGATGTTESKQYTGAPRPYSGKDYGQLSDNSVDPAKYAPRKVDAGKYAPRVDQPTDPRQYEPRERTPEQNAAAGIMTPEQTQQGDRELIARHYGKGDIGNAEITPQEFRKATAPKRPKQNAAAEKSGMTDQRPGSLDAVAGMSQLDRKKFMYGQEHGVNLVDERARIKAKKPE
jgi:hypothetical protein